MTTALRGRGFFVPAQVVAIYIAVDASNPARHPGHTFSRNTKWPGNRLIRFRFVQKRHHRSGRFRRFPLLLPAGLH